MRTRLSGVQWRIVLWVVRYTFGWNRRSTPFTWYRIAQEVQVNRSAVYRSGRALLRANLLVTEADQLALEMNSLLWDSALSSPQGSPDGQLWIPGVNVAARHRPTVQNGNAAGAGRQRRDCLSATVPRRVKDRSKDSLKTYIETHAAQDSVAQHLRRALPQEKHLLAAGAARPVPRKYDRLSKN
jgi:hypothetical protein